LCSLQPMTEPTTPTAKSSTINRKWWQVLGPGIITAALVFGPGSLTVTSKLGAQFGYQLWWVVLVAIGFMVVFTEMGARLGMASPVSSLAIIQQRWGKIAARLIGLGIFCITASFQAGNTVGAGLAFAELFGTAIEPWIIFFSLLAMGLLFFRSFYRVLEKIMIGLVGLMIVSFLITLLLAQPQWDALFRGLIPGVPAGAEVLTIALIASSFSVVGAFYQSYLVKEKGWSKQDSNSGRRESIAGVLILGLISSFILINAATVLYPQRIPVNSAADMGLALEPLYGNTATIIFMLGLFGASFSSLLGNATIGGALLSDAFFGSYQLSDAKVRRVILLVILIGAAIALKFGRLPLELIIFAQAITILIAPIIAIALLLVAKDAELMGSLKNSRWQTLVAFLCIGVLFFLAITHFRMQFIS
ncbi:MAG: Nramp family divalent metal transporter, partial [Bacteroidota bacterium]